MEASNKPTVEKANKRQALGKQGEDIAAAWLEARGMRILARNYRCRIGEIDVIGQMEKTLVIVEVRCRSSVLWGTPAESVNYKKKQKLRKVASCYLSQTGKEDSACRFDVLSILFDQAGAVERIEWFRNAF